MRGYILATDDYREALTLARAELAEYECKYDAILETYNTALQEARTLARVICSLSALIDEDPPSEALRVLDQSPLKKPKPPNTADKRLAINRSPRFA